MIRRAPVGGLPVVLDPALYNRIVDTLEDCAKFSVAAPLRMTRIKGAGTVVSLDLTPPALFKLTISGPVVGCGGRYFGKNIDGDALYNATGNLAESDLGTPSTDEDLIFWNIAEVGQSTHNIPNDTDVWGYQIGTDDGTIDESGTLRPIILGCAPPPKYFTFPVGVTMDGGSNGTKTTTASYTYTVQDVEGNELGTTLPQTKPRPKGTMTAGGGFGIAFYDSSGTLVLWDAGEKPGTGGCA